MRRWLSILLLVLVPFQFSWAAAASYCQHERQHDTGKLASHFGHHDHQHKYAKGESSDTETRDAVNKLGAVDNDCAMCHLNCVAPVAVLPALSFSHPNKVRYLTLVPTFESHISDVPHRPIVLLPPDSARATYITLIPTIS